MDKEIWKDIPGYEGFYRVSNMGRIRSLNRIIDKFGKGKYFIDGRILSPGISNKGYFYVNLHKKGKYNRQNIHILVLQSFDRMNKKGEVCRHLDNNQQNNFIENLCWGTRSENERDKIKFGTSNRGERQGLSKLNEMQVRIIKRLIHFGTMS